MSSPYRLFLINNHIFDLKTKYNTLKESGKVSQAESTLTLLNIEITYYNKICDIFNLKKISYE